MTFVPSGTNYAGNTLWQALPQFLSVADCYKAARVNKACYSFLQQLPTRRCEGLALPAHFLWRREIEADREVQLVASLVTGRALDELIQVPHSRSVLLMARSEVLCSIGQFEQVIICNVRGGEWGVAESDAVQGRSYKDRSSISFYESQSSTFFETRVRYLANNFSARSTTIEFLQSKPMRALLQREDGVKRILKAFGRLDESALLCNFAYPVEVVYLQDEKQAAEEVHLSLEALEGLLSLEAKEEEKEIVRSQCRVLPPSLEGNALARWVYSEGVVGNVELLALTLSKIPPKDRAALLEVMLSQLNDGEVGLLFLIVAARGDLGSLNYLLGTNRVPGSHIDHVLYSDVYAAEVHLAIQERCRSISLCPYCSCCTVM